MGMKHWKLWLDGERVEVLHVGELPRAEFLAIIHTAFVDAEVGLLTSLCDWAEDAQHVAFGTWRAKCKALTCECPVGSVSDFVGAGHVGDDGHGEFGLTDAEHAAHMGYGEFDNLMSERFHVVRGVVTITD